jgi:hypothetical protein
VEETYSGQGLAHWPGRHRRSTDREGKLRLFVAIDRTSKSAFVELHRQAGKMIAAQFLRNLIAALPYAIHTVLTDNGIQFTNVAHHKYAFHHIFDRVLRQMPGPNT